MKTTNKSPILDCKIIEANIELVIAQCDKFLEDITPLFNWCFSNNKWYE